MVCTKTTQTSKSSSSPKNSKKQRKNNLSMRSFLTKTWVGVFSTVLLATITSSSRTKHSSTIEQQNRMKKYDEMCKHNRSEEVPLSQFSDTTANSLSQIFYDDNFKLVLCTVPKAGTTNWQRVLSTLKSNFTTRPEAWKGQKIYKQANRLSKFLPDSDSVTQYELAKKVNDEDFLKVVSVRHPLTRLLSAWRDKFQMVESSKYWHKKYGNFIRSKYSRTDDVDDPDHYVTWLSFLRYIANEPEQYFDYHWRSFWRFCKPCDIRYDFIVKTESSESDAREIFRQLGIHQKIQLPKRYKNSLTASDYFNDIPRDLLLAIYDKYRMDFELFGYDIDHVE